MLNKFLKIQDTVDVYIKDLEQDEKVIVTFHKMTTRQRIEIITKKNVAEFLALLDGKKSVIEILNKLGEFSNEDAEKLITYLSNEHLLVDTTLNIDIDQRYDRQINYFDDMILDRRGAETQKLLASKNIVLLGCGAIGSTIAEILVRAGVQCLTLVDFKKITKSNIDLHLFATKENIGHSKVQALSEYLTKINHRISIKTFNEKLLPNTDLSKWIDNKVDLVINSCDEPYIGHTSLKVGRYLHHFKIPLYVAGGFDAHLMSSGELINPPFTPCIDCSQQTFTKALEGWKPTYSYINASDVILEDTQLDSKNNYTVGGAGGLIMMSGFSANLSCIKILQFLCEDSSFDHTPIRYEYLPNHGVMTEFVLSRQEECNVCNK
ncbi:ThiF family adenylyltransferase [Acinetobacter sp. ANC 4216]|uniref:ThiF family adenylyltransferase n=1 Tax=Acinetobacter sp. ANC 4216 TaxID=2529840 RepID=UPI0010400AC5|nr:ThiF family adenylyltransferase [Acinetobacter sp. ANC 4216]TCB69240.1 ThiF family adenylyltransferase [Acinetobacter sp. ANC 4216]